MLAKRFSRIALHELHCFARHDPSCGEALRSARGILTSKRVLQRCQRSFFQLSFAWALR